MAMVNYNLLGLLANVSCNESESETRKAHGVIIQALQATLFLHTANNKATFHLKGHSDSPLLTRPQAQL